MNVLTFDNPVTRCRECWQDGKLIAFYSADLLCQKGFYVHPRRFCMGANIGPWRSGQKVGDEAAMLVKP